MGGHLEQVKPGLCVPWEGPSRGCLVLEIRISATLTSLWGGGQRRAVGLHTRWERGRGEREGKLMQCEGGAVLKKYQGTHLPVSLQGRG